MVEVLRNAMPIGNVLRHRLGRLQENTSQHHRRIHRCRIHLIKMRCKTQAVVALSSAEAELYGIVRASAETMGLISMYKDLGTHTNGVVLEDLSAALAIVARRRLGKLRHLDTNYLWIQEKTTGGYLNFQ